MSLRWISGGKNSQESSGPASSATQAPEPRCGVWRGGLHSGYAFDLSLERNETFTRKYRDELAYWVSLRNGESQRMFGGPFWDIFRGWQIDRMVELAKALRLPDLEALRAWSATRMAVEIGPGPFPSISIVPWRTAIAVDPLADGYASESLIPPDANQVVFLTSAGESVPLVSGACDIVVAENCLDHVDDPPAVMNEVHRLLRPAGLFWVLVDLMEYSDHMHPNPFSEQSLRALFAATGFRIVCGGVSDHKSHPQATGEFRGLLEKR